MKQSEQELLMSRQQEMLRIQTAINAQLKVVADIAKQTTALNMTERTAQGRLRELQHEFSKLYEREHGEFDGIRRN